VNEEGSQAEKLNVKLEYVVAQDVLVLLATGGARNAPTAEMELSRLLLLNW
jgi:hypothetical protein